MATVLVVEDEPINRKILASQLQSYEHGRIEPAFCRNAEQAVRWIRESDTLDAAIVDLYLNPSQDGGFEVMEAMRARFPGAPVIVLTIRNDSAAAERTKTFDAARYFIDKQRWTESTLIECLRRCLSGEAKGLEMLGDIEA